MKFKNIILGIGILGAMTGCNDYLDVDAPSRYENDYVFGSTGEMNTALNGVYAEILSGNTFGGNLYRTLQLNSDVDFSANSNENAQTNAPQRFDCTSDASSASSLWNQLYETVEVANNFIYNAENSKINTPGNEDYADVQQMIGEAKVMRAMAYYELLCYYGDVPFTFKNTYQSQDFVPPITSRDTVYAEVINDLRAAAPHMKYTSSLSEGVERISKEACWAMIARMALQAGGYSLRPNGENSYGKMERPNNYKDFYTIARNYADSVILAGTHHLSNSYKQVFENECNFRVINNDDPIFEIPFAKGSTGGWGYYQGPTASSSNGVTPHVYGECSGSVRLEAFYRYTFDEKDLRRDYVNGLWYYSSTGEPVMRADYSVHNNKWSKLWNATGLGANTTGSTGINFAYLRYADVLLMFAEAENELNGPTAEAQAALKEVRNRAFSSEDRAEKVDAYVAQAASSKESFLKAVLNERKWELAGENSRWKDLVRNNLYGKTLFETFMRYYAVAENAGVSSSYMDMVENEDGIKWSEILPTDIYSCYIQNPGDGSLFPNTTLPIRFIVNPYKAGTIPQVKPQTYFEQNNLPYTAISLKDITGLAGSSSTIGWTDTQFYNWWEDAGYPRAQVLYSLFGYMRGDVNGNIYLVRDGKAESVDPLAVNKNDLPVVRYLLPIPQEAITRSGNVYTEHYGY